MLNEHPGWLDLPAFLSVEEIDKPELVIKEFIESYDMKDVRELLDEWCYDALSSDSNASQTGRNRGNFLYFAKTVKRLTEAIFLLHDVKVQGKTRQALQEFFAENHDATGESNSRDNVQSPTAASDK